MKTMVPWHKATRGLPSSRWDQEYPLHSFQQAFNKLFDEFFSGMELSSWRLEEGQFIPHTDMSEDDNAVHINMELPGMDENDVDINMSSDVITIKGEKKLETKNEDEAMYCVERVYGSFIRELPLPAEVDAEHAEASFKKGVLTINIPKMNPEHMGLKRIHIKSS